MSEEERVARTAKAMGATCASVCVPVSDDTVMFCEKCGKVLMVIKAGDYFFHQVYGQHCDCDWHCCEFSAPGAQHHEQHIAFRNVKTGIVVARG